MAGREMRVRGGHLSKSGNFTRGPRSLRCASYVALSALSLGFLGACAGLQNQIATGSAYPPGPDVMDRVRSIDLLPRSPQSAAGTDTSGGVSAKTQVYPGETVPGVEGASVRGAPPGISSSGEGLTINFENASIATVAKYVLGDS